MCLITLNKPESLSAPASVLTPQEFEISLGRNSDGCGFMWVHDNKIMTRKFLDEDDVTRMFWKELITFGEPFAMHMRMATNGDVNTDNCHPFKVLAKDDGDPIDLYVMHNGVLSAHAADRSRSDTVAYTEKVLQPLLKSNHNLLSNPAFCAMLERDIGYNNKLLFLDSLNNYTIINKEKGVTRDAGWLSNTYSITPPPPPVKHDPIPFTQGTSSYKYPVKNPQTFSRKPIDMEYLTKKSTEIKHIERQSLEAACKYLGADYSVVNDFMTERMKEYSYDDITVLVEDWPEETAIILGYFTSLFSAK